MPLTVPGAEEKRISKTNVDLALMELTTQGGSMMDETTAVIRNY